MTLESFRNYCLSLGFVDECFPFDNETLVFKCGGKIFALTNITLFESVNLKCEPEYALELRSCYHSIQPGYHMNKKHWNTILLYGDVKDVFLIELINHSYQLIFNSLPKKVKENLNSSNVKN
ncbi:MAG: MmcQ/YjbR family DNA-binding protein [Flavobacteriia bacterium]|nr:MmcQ/YjbR family DNA-binding protein [Flavobacteriia bacterium]